MTLRVLLIDDHPMYRAGLRLVLSRFAPGARIDEVSGLGDALDRIGDTAFDLIVYDWHLPDGGGVRGLISVCQTTSTPVIVVSGDEEEAVIHTALRVGARGYVPKSADTDSFCEALARVLAGKTCAPAAAPVGVATEPLTDRQHQVLRLIALGYSNKRIAATLHIAETTVRAHVSDILAMLQADNRTEAVAEARRRGLLDQFSA